jgi:ABC-type glycerol-3-phosphate transport system substrate-binding protein
MRWLIIAAATLALAVAAAGCGGSDEESSGTTTDTTVVTETTTDESTTEETTTGETTEETTTDLSGVLGSEDCIQLVAALASLGQAFAAPGSGDDASDFFGNFDPPDEIKDDIQTLSEWYQAYAAAVKDAGFEPGTTPSADQLQSFQAAIASLDQEGVSAASERIGVWAQTNCQS